MRFSLNILLLLLLLLSLSCQAPVRIAETLAPTQPTVTIDETRISIERTPILGTPEPSQTPDLPESTRAPVPVSAACAYSPVTAGLLEKTSAEQWLGWIKKLSGAEPVQIGGVETRITTRYSPAMFSGSPHARAFDFVLETLQGWYPQSQIALSDYTVTNDQGQEFTWKNLILTLPGETSPQEIVILSAHLDSITSADPQTIAPGAEDNGSGSAALLEAARLLRDYHFQRTIQIVWFSGEEEGLLGSRAFVKQIADPAQVLGVVNLDMFGYDSDNDRCFELHVGTLPQSDLVGRCFIDSFGAYQLGLKQYDYLTDTAIRASDHASFWDANIGAIEVVEDVIAQHQPGGCPASDASPNYHTPQDTVDKINPDSGIALVRAALAAISALAGPIE